MEGKITQRVYGIVKNDKGMILLSDEIFMDKRIVKLPGGGMEKGESPEQCLHREFMEELGCEISECRFVYKTDFLQFSLFNPGVQVICHYFDVRVRSEDKIPVKNKILDFEEEKDGAQAFRWVEKLDALNQLSFPTDRIALGLAS